MNIKVISVMEFKKLWVLKSKMFANNKHIRKKTLNFENTKLGRILENKECQKL